MWNNNFVKNICILEELCMYINLIFELSMVLDEERFHKVLSHVHHKADCMEKEEYADQSLEEKGIVVIYRDSQYKKKIKLIIDPGFVSDSRSSDKLIRKLDKCINEYFDFQYKIDDFTLSGVTFTANIDVDSRENVLAYLKVLKRIGKVKGFSQSEYDCFEDIDSFCMEGNSNDIRFWIYDLEGFIRNQLVDKDITKKKMRSMFKESEGILRTEVRLIKPKAVRCYTGTDDVSGQIVELVEKSSEIFLDVFTHIIPYGDYYKKNRAVEIVRDKVRDSVLRRRMLRLLVLIPEKKSLYLAQKAMNCRNIEKVMEEFARINVSPVSISKRHDLKYLENLYSYILNDNKSYHEEEHHE